MKQGATGRTVFPLTTIIVPSIEARFARMRALQRANVRMDDLLALASRETRRVTHTHLLLTQSRSKAQKVLSDACRRMGDVDLDTAWLAALRGDDAVMHERVLPHVQSPPMTRQHKGTPWRMSGWLSRRAT
jgi:putative alpha-1,2-mannosidase